MEKILMLYNHVTTCNSSQIPIKLLRRPWTFFSEKSMMQSDFKNINVVPIGNEFVDLVLSHIHRQKPTLLLRKGFNINSLRQFYTRKVKKTELSFRGKLSTIIDEFPRLDEIHPLYCDLLRLIFDRGRYKLALGQVNTSRHLITKIANDYVVLLKCSESLKQCKALKVGAIRGMFNVINEITPSLAYLEQIRQHMLKLPSIDPNSPTLLISGYPIVEKTCFMNRVNNTRGCDNDDDDNFTTKSVVPFAVGHTEYKGLRYQLIDAPGVLDKPTFGDCNVITALAHHLPKSLVLFFMDVSGECGYSIAQQAGLLHSLKCVFVNKPFLIVCHESDLMQDWKLIEEMISGMGANEEEEEVVLKISDLGTEEGVMSVKNVACERLLDDRERLSCIAQANVGDLRNKSMLVHEKWKDSKIPQTLDDACHVSDLLVNPYALVRLEELECEKGLLKQDDEDEEDDFVMAEERFTEEHKDNKLTAIGNIQALRIFIGLAFFILVGNTYGAIQECLSTLSF